MKYFKFLFVCLLTFLPLAVYAGKIPSDVSYVSYSAEITGTFSYGGHLDQTLQTGNIVYSNSPITLTVHCPGATSYVWSLVSGGTGTQWSPMDNMCSLYLGQSSSAGLQVDAYGSDGVLISTQSYYFMLH